MNELMMKMLEATARAAGFPEPQNIFEIVGAVIGAFLSLVGVIYLGLIIYGGFLWMTSAGKEPQMLKAKQTITRSTVGVIIILSSYSISYFVLHALAEATY